MSLKTLEWHHNERDGVSYYRRPDRLLNRVFMYRLTKTAKLRVPGLFEGSPPVTGAQCAHCEFPSQRANNSENISIWLRHQDLGKVNNYKNRVHISFYITGVCRLYICIYVGIYIVTWCYRNNKLKPMLLYTYISEMFQKKVVHDITMTS